MIDYEVVLHKNRELFHITNLRVILQYIGTSQMICKKKKKSQMICTVNFTLSLTEDVNNICDWFVDYKLSIHVG